MAKKYAMTVIPTHQPSAVQMSLLTGWPFSRERSASIIAVTLVFREDADRGWHGVGGDERGADERQEDQRVGDAAAAPSMVFAVSPGMTASQVSTSVKRARMPAAASHSVRPAVFWLVFDVFDFRGRE